MEILHSLANQLDRQFPFNQILVCDGDDYPVPTILVSVKAREPLGWTEIVAIRLEETILKLQFCHDMRGGVSTDFIKSFATFDIADPKFDPTEVSSALAVMLRGQGRFKNLVDGYMNRTPKDKSGEKKKKAAKRKARKAKRRGR